jgi:putative zinc finger/helix-turn-helix YgiT family protein
MTEHLSCPHCEAVREVELVERQEKVTIKGREIAFRAQLWRCKTCGEEFESPGQLDANLSAAREAYERSYEAPTAKHLVDLRSHYGASQKAFGLVLGFGELTMNSYEQGAIPDSTNRLLLKLAENPVFFRAMYAANSARIGALQRQRIESSGGFRSAESWLGLEALAATLTPLQRCKIEACAERYGQTVIQQVTAYVSAASFEDYSRLLLDAIWPSGQTTTLTEQAVNPPIDAQQAAS